MKKRACGKCKELHGGAGWLCEPCHAAWLKDKNRHVRATEDKPRKPSQIDRVIHMEDEGGGHPRTPSFEERLREGFRMLDD